MALPNINPQFRPLKLNFQYNMGAQQPEEEAMTPAPTAAPAPTTAPAPTSGYQYKLPQTMMKGWSDLVNDNYAPRPVSPTGQHSLLGDVTTGISNAAKVIKGVAKGGFNNLIGGVQDALHIGQDIGRGVVNNAVIPAANYVAGTNIKPISTPSTPAATPAVGSKPYVPGDIIGSPMPDPSKIKPIRSEASGADFAHGGMLPQNVKREENGTFTRSIYDDQGNYKGWVNQKSIPDNLTVSTKPAEQPMTPTSFGGLKNTMFDNQQKIERMKKAAQAGTYGSTSPGSSYR